MIKYKFTQIMDENLESIKEKYKDIPEETLIELLKLNPNYKENEVDNYGRWILNLYRKGNLKKEDFYKVPDYLKEFEEKKKNIANKDINSYKTLPDLAKVLEETQTPEQSKNQLRKAIRRTDLGVDAEFIGDFGKFVCYSPKTYEASCKLGANTEWCTATNSDRNYYDRYSSQGKLYIFIDKSTNQAEYQLHFETESFMDRYDDEIDLKDFANNICPESRKLIVVMVKKCINEKKMDICKYIWLDEILEYYKEEMKKKLKVKDGYIEIKIWFSYLSSAFSKNGRTDLNEGFLEDALKGDLDYYFDIYYTELDLDGYEEYLNDENKNRLKEYHLTYDNIRDIILLINNSINSGNINECISDVEYATDKAFNSIGCNSPHDYDEDSFKVSIKFDDYIKLVQKSCNDEDFIDELGYDTGSDPDDVLTYWASQNFKLYEPRYGWQGDFDEERFNDEISNWLDNLSLFEINDENKPYFQYDEDLEKWKIWFKKNILKEDIIAEGQQKMDLGDSMYKITKIEDGTRYDEQAAKIISDSGLFDEETSKNIIQGLFRQDIHAFVHSPNWLEKYLKGIARMLVQYCNGDKSKAQQFLTECPDVFENYLTWVKQNREKIGSSLDEEFVNKMSYEDVKNKIEEIQKQVEKQSKKELSEMKFTNNSSYSLVPINSYEEFNSKYGGKATGDGSSDEFAGGGGTAWCHANNYKTYKHWVNEESNGLSYKKENKFFVLQNNNWQNIPFNPETNEKYKGKDEYGNSLIAILTDKYGKLKKVTLRCNHIGVENNADNQYNSYAELSKIAGFNVEEEVKKYCEEKPDNGGLPDCFMIENGVLKRNYNHITNVTIEDIEEITIPDNVHTIGYEAFYHLPIEKIIMSNSVKRIESDAFSGCSDLEEIKLSNSLEEIGDSAFRECKNLKNINIPDSVIKIGDRAFGGCIKLTSIKLPNNLSELGKACFVRCGRLKEVIIPNAIKYIPEEAFMYCLLEEVSIPEGIESIKDYAFGYCEDLRSVKLPDSIKYIGYSAFKQYSEDGLTVYTNNKYVIDRFKSFDNVKCKPLKVKDSIYTFKDKKDLNYVYKLGFVYRDENGNLKRKSYYYIKDYYESKYKGKGKFKDTQIDSMIKRASEDCNNYIELHKDDILEENLFENKNSYKDMSKKAYINYLINSGYSEIDAQDKADALYGEDDD